MVKPPTRLGGGVLLFSSDAHKEAYMEERVQALLQEKIRDHIRVLGLTPEGEAEEWAAIAIALASVTSREAAKRKRRVKNPCVVAALSIENARITSAVPMPRKRESKRPR